MIADHFAVSCIRKKTREQVYTNYNAKTFTDLLRNKLAVSNYMQFQDPNELWDLILSCVIDILEIMCPIRRFKQREKLTPWMDASIYRDMRFRDILCKLFRRTRSNESLCGLRRQRNIVNSRVESAKKAYIYKILQENNKNPRKFWKLVNELLNGRRSTVEHAQFVDPHSNVNVPPGDEAEFLNNYFCNITDRLGIDTNVYPEQLQLIEMDLNELYGHIDTTFDLTDDLITVDELEHCTSTIDLTKGISIPGIGTFICRDILKFLTIQVTFLFNRSIESGIFPRSWSKGTVTVLSKNENPSDPSNWRPITQTPIFAKVFEKLVHKRIIHYIEEHEILSTYQYGFRPRRSTKEAVFDLTKFIYTGFNNSCMS